MDDEIKSYPKLNPPVEECAEFDVEKVRAHLADEWEKIRWYGRPMRNPFKQVETAEN